MPGPLAGIRVLDITRVLAGPYAGMLLADLGAEVIKVELPGVGDDSRKMGPFQEGESMYFNSVNRGKRGITLNLRTLEAQEILKQLITVSDVLLENFRPGAMKRFGLDYESVEDLNPRLIYASVSGFGHTGPYAERPAYDAIIQAMGGIVSITGPPDGAPVRVGASIADLGAALFSAVAILAALHARNEHGQGQHIDLSMLDCQVALLENAVARYLTTGQPPKPLGSRHPSITPFEFFETKDGYIVIAVGNDSLWAKLCAALELDDMIDDERFRNNADRTENYEALRPPLADRLRTRTTDEWLPLLEAAGVPCGPINTIDRLLDDPQVQAREMMAEVVHSQIGSHRVPGSPFNFSRDPVELKRSGPALGEDTQTILRELAGLSDEEIDRLRERGVC